MSVKKLAAEITNESQSGYRRYQQLVVGSSSLAFTIKYELVTGLFGNMPGAPGLWFRQQLYKSLFAKSKGPVIFGSRITLRQPTKISLGNSVIISDGCVLEVRGDADSKINIGDEVILSQNTLLVCKEGSINLGNGIGVGANSSIYAVAGNRIVIGNNALIGPYNYIGGTSYHIDRTDIPISAQGHDPQGGVNIEENVWLGARCTILDGITIGHDAIVATGAVVTKDVPPFAIVGGVPATIIKHRKQ